MMDLPLKAGASGKVSVKRGELPGGVPLPYDEQAATAIIGVLLPAAGLAPCSGV